MFMIPPNGFYLYIINFIIFRFKFGVHCLWSTEGTWKCFYLVHLHLSKYHTRSLLFDHSPRDHHCILVPELIASLCILESKCLFQTSGGLKLYLLCYTGSNRDCQALWSRAHLNQAQHHQMQRRLSLTWKPPSIPTTSPTSYPASQSCGAPKKQYFHSCRCCCDLFQTW